MKCQKGSISMLGIMIMVFFGIILAGILPSAISTLKNSQSGSNQVAAQYIAEAGAKRAITEFYKSNQDWTWLKKSILLNNQGYYYVTIEKEKNEITPASPAPAGIYIIRSTGTVGNSVKTVQLSIQVSSNGNENGNNQSIQGDVFGKYAVFSNRDFNIYGGSSPAPAITGGIGVNGDNVKVDMGDKTLASTIFTKYKPNYIYYPNAPKDWYVITPSVGTLSISLPDLPPTPTMPTSASSNPVLPTTGGNQNWNSNFTLTQPSYYFDSSYLLAGTSRMTANNGQEVSLYINGGLKLDTTASIVGDKINIYINGDFELANNSLISVANSSNNSTLNIYVNGNVKLSTNTQLVGDNINIYANNIELANDSSIKAYNNINSGQLNLFVKGNFLMSNQTVIQSDTITIKSGSNSNDTIRMSGTSNINKDRSSALTYIYSGGSVNLTNQISIGGSAGMVVTNSFIKIDNQVQAPNIMFFANDPTQQSYITGSAGAVWWPQHIEYPPVQIAGMYTNGSLKIDGSPIIRYNSNVVNLLGLNSSGTGSKSVFTISDWSSK